MLSRSFLDFSVGVVAFVIGLSHSSFFSYAIILECSAVIFNLKYFKNMLQS